MHKIEQKGRQIFRLVLYVICISLFFTNYYNVGAILLVLTVGGTFVPKNNSESRKPLMMRNTVWAIFAAVYFAIASIVIFNYSDIIYNLPFGVLLGILFIPFIPDIINHEMDTYKGKTGSE